MYVVELVVIPKLSVILYYCTEQNHNAAEQ